VAISQHPRRADMAHPTAPGLRATFPSRSDANLEDLFALLQDRRETAVLACNTGAEFAWVASIYDTPLRVVYAEICHRHGEAVPRPIESDNLAPVPESELRALWGDR